MVLSFIVAPPFACSVCLGMRKCSFPIFYEKIFKAHRLSASFGGLGMSSRHFPIFGQKNFRSVSGRIFLIKEAILPHA